MKSSGNSALNNPLSIDPETFPPASVPVVSSDMADIMSELTTLFQ